MPAVRAHLMTDFRGYGRLIHRSGAAEAGRRLRIYERIVRERLPSKSAEVDHIGDGFHLAFAAPRAAVRVAIEIADALAKHNGEHPDLNVPIAFGIEVGERPARGDQGFAPIIATHLCGRAKGGQVLITETVRALLGPPTNVRDLGMLRLAGAEIHIFEARAADTVGVVPEQPDRFLSALLFEDIVRSTATAVAMGDRNWRDLVERHNSIVREELERHGGSEIDTAGDGFYASFVAPSRAIQCALDLRDRLRAEGLEVRVGVHVAECEVVAGKLGGVATVVGARMKDHAAPGDVLVSRTVRDLVIGMPFSFEERGSYELKGIPGMWELYAITAPAAPATPSGGASTQRARALRGASRSRA